jgi:hypothetical protein
MAPGEGVERGGLDGSRRRVKQTLARAEAQKAPEEGGVETSWRGGPDDSRRMVEQRLA